MTARTMTTVPATGLFDNDKHGDADDSRNDDGDDGDDGDDE